MNPAADFTLADFQRQVHQMRALGAMNQVLKGIPGLGSIAELLAGMELDCEMARIDAIISSMTPWERNYPHLISEARQRRIAKGSGTSPDRVMRLLADFAQMSRVMREWNVWSQNEQSRRISSSQLDGTAPLLDAAQTPRWAKWGKGLWWFRPDID
jgi:signal recognition particle subunit SRP54